MVRGMPRSARFAWASLSFFLLECAPSPSVQNEPARNAVEATRPAEDLHRARQRMVREQIEARGVRNSRVLAAMRKVERHRFVPEALQRMAYSDQPLPIGHGQTISQPYIVAYMTEALELRPSDRVLEIGTGSGYQAAVLAELVKKVYSIEIVEALAKESAERLKNLGYADIQLRTGNGYRGWPEEAPFDAIIVTAAPERIPSALLDQLAQGGRLVVPVGTMFQELVRVRRTPDGFKEERLLPVRFVPMVGEAEASE